MQNTKLTANFNWTEAKRNTQQIQAQIYIVDIWYDIKRKNPNIFSVYQNEITHLDYNKCFQKLCMCNILFFINDKQTSKN